MQLQDLNLLSNALPLETLSTDATLSKQIQVRLKALSLLHSEPD